MEANETKKLTKNQLRRAIGEQLGNWLWGRRSKKPKSERVQAILEYRRLRASLDAGQYVDELNARGNIVHRDIDADLLLGFKGGSRYPYDQKLCASGWKQYDTDQDAPYFGCWVHIEKRMTMCYCEGDRILVICPTMETLKAELDNMAQFYGPPPAAFIHVDNNRCVTHIIEARPAVAA